MELSYALSNVGYEAEIVNYDWTWRGSTSIEVKISYKITNNQFALTSPFTGNATYSINVASIIHN